MVQAPFFEGLVDTQRIPDGPVSTEGACTSIKLFGQTPSLSVGRLYLPFGRFNSFMVSDPLALELAETRNTAGVISLEGETWSLQGGLFNGAVDSGRDTLDSYVAALTLTPASGVSFGLSYLSDLAESDAGLVADASLYQRDVAATSAFASFAFGPFNFAAELVAALDDFDAALVNHRDGAGNPDTPLTGRRPQAWNLELAWHPVDKLQFAGRLEQARGFQGDPTRYGVTVAYGLFAHTVVALEYLHQEARQSPDGDIATSQLALEF